MCVICRAVDDPKPPFKFGGSSKSFDRIVQTWPESPNLHPSLCIRVCLFLFRIQRAISTLNRKCWWLTHSSAIFVLFKIFHSRMSQRCCLWRSLLRSTQTVHPLLLPDLVDRLPAKRTAAPHALESSWIPLPTNITIYLSDVRERTRGHFGIPVSHLLSYQASVTNSTPVHFELRFASVIARQEKKTIVLLHVKLKFRKGND